INMSYVRISGRTRRSPEFFQKLDHHVIEFLRFLYVRMVCVEKREGRFVHVYSSGRISTYLRNHSRAFSQYANHWLGFVVPTCQAAGARTNSTGTLPINFNLI